MGAGVFTGVFWGLVVSAIVVALVSLSAPLPQRPGEAGGPPPAEMVAEALSAPEAGDTPAETASTEEAQPEETAPEETAPEETASEETAPTQPAVPPALAALEGAQPGPSLDPQTGGAVSTIPLPAGSEFNRPPPEEAPVLPATDETPSVAVPAAPQADVPDAPGGVETAPAPQPDIATTPLEPAQPDAADAPLPEIGRDTPTAPETLAPRPLVRPEPDAVAYTEAESVPPPAAEAPDTAPEVSEPVPDPVPDPAPDPVAEAPEAEDAPQAAPDTADAPTPAGPEPDAPEPDAEAPSETAEADTDSETPASPPVVVQLVPPQESAPLAMVPLDDLPPAGDADALPDPPRLLQPGNDEDTAEVPRALPQIVSPARNVPEGGAATGSDVPVADLDGDAPGAEADGDGDTDRPALEAYAMPFDAEESRPLMAVILIDQPDDRLDIETLTRFSFPVAFAIDPSRPDAAERAAIYREAGFEVLMLASVIPEGATATDTDVALSVARDRVPEAIAIMDTPESRVQSERMVLEATVGVAARAGQGFVAFPRGLNTAEQMAERAEVPAATLFRLLDDEDQRATVITRYLGRAEFAAAQEGAVVVAGRTRPDTVTALFSWALGDRNEGVAIAPLSEVLRRLGQE
jgi:polysaccharide deacetylase 2 family uncharacterized protein YibQ